MGACDPGYADCDAQPSTGCEIDLTSDVMHCGKCTLACQSAPNTTSTCSSSTCSLACSNGWKDCNANLADGCEKSGASYKDVVLSDGPIGYWRLGETTGTTSADASGHGHDLTFHSGVNRGLSGALSCDADMAAGFVSTAKGWLEAAPATALEPASALSIELWFLQTGTLSANEKVIYYSYYNADPWGSWGFQRSGSTQNVFVFELNLGNKAKWLNSTSVLAKDTWYHVVLTYDGALMALYLNGALNASMAATGTIGYNHSAYGLAVGAWALPTSYFTGSVDELAIYDKALSATRVSAHYAAGKL